MLFRYERNLYFQMKVTFTYLVNEIIMEVTVAVMIKFNNHPAIIFILQRTIVIIREGKYKVKLYSPNCIRIRGDSIPAPNTPALWG